MRSRPFDYILTIHNKEDLLEQVLAGVAASAGQNARVIPVLDGCTDGSADIVERFRKTSGIDTVVVTAPDVHEILSINLGLEHARQGYCVLLQDDVILEEPTFERKIEELCDRLDRRLGYLSLRLAADVRATPFYKRAWLARRIGLAAFPTLVEECDFIGGPGEHLDVARAEWGEFHARMVGIKSPVVITPELRLLEPALDPQFAPYCYDDVDLSLRSLRRGFINGLYALRFQSDVEWGGTRKDPDFAASAGYRVRIRNRRFVWQKHGRFIAEASQGRYSAARSAIS